MMRNFGYGMGYGYSSLSWIPELIIWVVIIAAIIALVKYMTHHDGYRHGHDMGHMHDEGGDALEILKQRYAKGEITKKEFEDIKKDISD